jgi:hypothetical protein
MILIIVLNALIKINQILNIVKWSFLDEIYDKELFGEAETLSVMGYI